MKLLVFVGLCTIFVIINGFEYGKDKVRTACWFDKGWLRGDTIDPNYYHYVHGKFDSTVFVRHCPYENRIHFHCKSGNVDPNAYLVIWDENDHGPDGWAGKTTLTHIEADGKSGYFDVYIPTKRLYGRGDIAHLYGKFIYPCNNVRDIRVGNLLLDNFSFE
uniref:Uncharacterized protein n=1 Tax=Panagrolaimus sp. JU765 TaxID=591449 RepID=A0AC34RF10_9BILA